MHSTMKFGTWGEYSCFCFTLLISILVDLDDDLSGKIKYMDAKYVFHTNGLFGVNITCLKKRRLIKSYTCVSFSEFLHVGIICKLFSSH